MLSLPHDKAEALQSGGASPGAQHPRAPSLFWVASRTGWERAGITRATVTTLVVRVLIERDVAGGLTITKQGRAVLAALLMDDDE